MMIINRAQIKALDAVAVDVFLGRIEVHAIDPVSAESTGLEELRMMIRSHYAKAVAMGLRTERKIAVYILEQLKTQVDERT